MVSRGFKFAAVLGVVVLHLHIAKSADSAMAVLKNKQGGDVDSVELVQTDKGVLLRLNLKALPAGERAFHIHEAGKCEAPFDLQAVTSTLANTSTARVHQRRLMPATCRISLFLKTAN